MIYQINASSDAFLCAQTFILPWPREKKLG